MYKSGMKLVELCKMTRSMADIEEVAIEAMQARGNESISIGYESIDQIV